MSGIYKTLMMVVIVSVSITIVSCYGSDGQARGLPGLVHHES